FADGYEHVDVDVDGGARVGVVAERNRPADRVGDGRRIERVVQSDELVGQPRLGHETWREVRRGKSERSGRRCGGNASVKSSNSRTVRPRRSTSALIHSTRSGSG